MIHNNFDKSFRKFINQEDSFDQSEKQEIFKRFESNHHKRVFRLSIILLLWSVVAVFIDSALIGGGLVASLMNGASIMHFLPEIIFIIVNYFLKVWFIYWYMKGNIKNNHAFYCGIPYIGSALILGFLLKEEPLFLNSLKKYSTYLRKRGFRYVCSKLKFKKKI